MVDSVFFSSTRAAASASAVLIRCSLYHLEQKLLVAALPNNPQLLAHIGAAATPPETISCLSAIDRILLLGPA